MIICPNCKEVMQYYHNDEDKIYYCTAKDTNNNRMPIFHEYQSITIKNNLVEKMEVSDQYGFYSFITFNSSRVKEVKIVKLRPIREELYSDIYDPVEYSNANDLMDYMFDLAKRIRENECLT
jgi:hypothetical protein